MSNSIPPCPLCGSTLPVDPDRGRTCHPPHRYWATRCGAWVKFFESLLRVEPTIEGAAERADRALEEWEKRFK